MNVGIIGEGAIGRYVRHGVVERGHAVDPGSGPGGPLNRFAIWTTEPGRSL